MRIGSNRKITEECGSMLQVMEPTVNPRKMATPPRDGVIFLWILRLPGWETIFFFFEKRMINGRNAREMTKEVMPASRELSIGNQTPKVCNPRER
jgi:hypothetical protein